MPSKAAKSITIITPCYNEATNLRPLFKQLTSVFSHKLPSYNWEWIVVNDASTDRSASILDKLAQSHSHIRVLHLARNLGQQIALTAGLDFATGDYIVTLDCDLQDPPSLIPRLIRPLESGHDLVHTKRRSRQHESLFKTQTAQLYYRLLNSLTRQQFIENSGDYRAFNRRVLHTIRTFREPHRYLRGMFTLIGFRHTTVTYARPPRHSGTSGYTLSKMIGLGLNGLFSFSTSPIYLIMILSLTCWLISLVYLLHSLYQFLILKTTVPGWTSLLILLTFFTGLILFSLSMIGAYIAKIFEQGQSRPLYWLSHTQNLNPKHHQLWSHHSETQLNHLS